MMKRGIHTNKVEIFEIADFDTGTITRKVLINDKQTYEETVTAIIDRQSADKGSQVKQFIDWLLGIEHKPEVKPKKLAGFFAFLQPINIRPR